MNIFKKFLQRKQNNFKIQTFTYYIPAPPARSSGYREKQFDKVFFDFINRGFEIISVNTESHTSENQSGMWVLLIVRATNKEAEKLNLDDYIQNQPINNKNEINGLYYINEKN